MSHSITPSLRASLERLKHAGAVNGICIAWRRQILVSLMPYEEFRIEQLVQTVSDSREHFQSGGERLLDSIWLGFPDVHVLAVFADDITVMMLHARPEEADFLTSAIKTFLGDAQLTIAAALSPENHGETSDERSDASEDDVESEEWTSEEPEIDPNRTNVLS